MMQAIQFLFRRSPLTDIAHDDRKKEIRFPLPGGHTQLEGKFAAVFPTAEEFQRPARQLHPFKQSNPLNIPFQFLMVPLGDDHRHRLTDDFLGRIAEGRFSTLVPERHFHERIDQYDGVFRRLHNGAQPLLADAKRILDPAAFGHITNDAQDPDDTALSHLRSPDKLSSDVPALLRADLHRTGQRRPAFKNRLQHILTETRVIGMQQGNERLPHPLRTRPVGHRLKSRVERGNRDVRREREDDIARPFHQTPESIFRFKQGILRPLEPRNVVKHHHGPGEHTGLILDRPGIDADPAARHTLRGP